MGRPKSTVQFNDYLAVCEQRGIVVTEARVEGTSFVFKFARKDDEQEFSRGGAGQPIDFINWARK